MTTSNHKPIEITIEGAKFLLYEAGIKRGHSEALQEQIANFQRIAINYRTTPIPEDRAKDALALATVADVLDKLAAELAPHAEKANADSLTHFHAAMEAVQRERGSLIRRFFAWVSRRAARLAA